MASVFSQLYPTHSVYDWRKNYDPSMVTGVPEQSKGSVAKGALGLYGSLPANAWTMDALEALGAGGIFGRQEATPWHETHTPYGPYPYWGDPMQSFSGYQGQPKVAAAPGTTTYAPPGWETSADLAKQYSLVLEGMPGRSSKQYRTERNWADWWREAVGQSLGIEGQMALDPLSQLQSQLIGNIATEPAGEPLEATAQVSAYTNQLADALRQRAAGMGVSNIYDPSISLQQRTIDTMASQAQAAYRPQAWQQQQQYDTQIQQLLQSLQQSEYMRDLAVQSAGR